MKKLSIFILFYCFLSTESFPQPNYAIFGYDNDVLRGCGCILRFEVRDLDTRIPIENANIEIYGVNNQEIANFKTDNRGIGIFIIKDILRHYSYTPDKYLIRFTKSNYRYYELGINSQGLTNESEGLSIILSKDYLVSWSGVPTPTYDELARFVSTKNYDIAKHVGYSNGGPPIFEFSITLEQIRNSEYSNNPNPTVNTDQIGTGWREIKSGEFDVIKEYKKGDMELSIRPSRRGVISGYRVSLITTTVSSNGYSISARHIDENGNITEAEPSYTQSEAIRIINEFMSSHRDNVNQGNPNQTEIQNQTKEGNVTSSQQIESHEFTKTNIQEEYPSPLVENNAVIFAKLIKVIALNNRRAETSLNNHFDKLKVCFTLIENHNATAGEKKVFIRVIRPDSHVITTGNNQFSYKGKSLQYSESRIVSYMNQDIEMCIFIENTGDFIQGNYSVEIYLENSIIGRTTFTLL